MKVSSLVYATWQGLGIMARSFYHHGVITNPIVVRHPHHQTQNDWYPDAPQTDIRPFNEELVKEHLSGSNVVLFFETPFSWTLIDWCRSRGIKTVLCVNYECSPKYIPSHPDLFICPSLLDLEYFSSYRREQGISTSHGLRWSSFSTHTQATFLPVPVEVPWRLRERCLTFCHHRGHGSFRDRNGTNTTVEAWRYVKSPAQLLIRSQEPYFTTYRDSRIKVEIGTCSYEELWKDSDCFIFVESWNGLSLPLQEARASGMLVIAGDRFPINTWLPKETLIKPSKVVRASIGGPYNDFEESLYDPRSVAEMVDRWYGKDVSDYSKFGLEWAKPMSWDSLKGMWMRTLEELCQ